MSTPLQKLISKKKKQQESENLDVRSFVIKQAEEITNKFLKELKPIILNDVKEIVSNSAEHLSENLKQENAIILNKEIKTLTENTKKGDKGDRGEKGEAGYTPIKGVDYFDGKPGRDGRDGLQGERGNDGKDGVDGLDGSPDMPQQIADKLNTLEEKVDIKVIRGLNNILRSIQGSLREKGQRSFGGGGMGNTETKSVAISSATTTITLDSSVASNGKAIWFNYQGQQQAYGVHFTVSGNVITLLFTPADNTYADIIYIRS